jgi:hypothetical protein
MVFKNKFIEFQLLHTFVHPLEVMISTCDKSWGEREQECLFTRWDGLVHLGGFSEEGSLYSHVGTNFVHFLATGVLPRMQSPNVHLAGVCRYGALQVRCVSIFCASLNPLPSLSPRLFLSLSPFPPFFLPRELQCAKDLLHIDRLLGFFRARKKIRKIKQAIAVFFRFVLFSFLL